MKRHEYRQARHRGPAQTQPDHDYQADLSNLMLANIDQIAETAKAKGLPENAALIVVFTEDCWTLNCVDLDTAADVAQSIGPELNRAFTLTALMCAIGLHVPALLIYGPERLPGYATAATTISRH